jgi:GT2 family glycosyltransferase
VFGRYGNFRPDLGVSGGDENRGITCDDTEFGLRLVNAREKIIYMPTALVHHPVEPHRPTKTYFLKWFYNDGRSGIRTFGWPDNTACLFRIPRWLYRGVLANFLQWMFTFDSKRRFHHKLRTYRALGRIVEAHRLANKPAVRGKEAFAGLSRPGP